MDVQAEIRTVLDQNPLRLPDALKLVVRYAPGKLDLYRYHNLPVAQKRKKLRKELATLLGTELTDLPVVKVVQEFAPPKRHISEILADEFPKLEFAKLPDNLKLLVIRRFECKRLAVDEHAKMHTAETDPERFEATLQCAKLMAENWEIWDELDNYHRKGEVLGKHHSFKVDKFHARIQEIENTMTAAQATKTFIGMMRTASNSIYKQRKHPEKEELVLRWIKKYDVLAAKLGEPTWEEQSNQSTTKKLGSQEKTDKNEK